MLTSIAGQLTFKKFHSSWHWLGFAWPLCLTALAFTASQGGR